MPVEARGRVGKPLWQLIGKRNSVWDNFIRHSASLSELYLCRLP